MILNLKGLSAEEAKELVPDNLIFLGYRGSIAHGMYIPNSDPDSVDDKDIMGVFFAQPGHYIGIQKEKETRERVHNEWDSVCYELRKLLYLLAKGNPNVLSLLWLDERHILYTSDHWKKIQDIREAFVCKNVYHSFSGYARGQLHRMTHCACEGYMGKKRKVLVAKYGYDCKNAAHLIRLLKMGIEFLTEGTLYVERTSDASQLLEIKHGEWTLEEVKKESTRLFSLCDEAYIKSPLMNKPDIDQINAASIDILKDYLCTNTYN